MKYLRRIEAKTNRKVNVTKVSIYYLFICQVMNKLKFTLDKIKRI